MNILLDFFSHDFLFVDDLDAAPDITQLSQFNNTRRGADRVTRYVNVSQTDSGDTGEYNKIPFIFHYFAEKIIFIH